MHSAYIGIFEFGVVHRRYGMINVDDLHQIVHQFLYERFDDVDIDAMRHFVQRFNNRFDGGQLGCRLQQIHQYRQHAKTIDEVITIWNSIDDSFQYVNTFPYDSCKYKAKVF